MIFYVNKFSGSVVLAYYDQDNKLKFDYFPFFGTEWEDLPTNHKTMNDLRAMLEAADICEILIDDGDA